MWACSESLQHRMALKMTSGERSEEHLKRVHLTYFTEDPVSEFRPANLETIQQHFPDHDVTVWTLSEVHKLMLDNGHAEIAQCFVDLIPFAYKSDLASYYLLNLYGGWYTDVNNFFVAGPPDVSECTMYLFTDVHDEPAPWSISTSMFYARANSPALSRVIDLVLENYRRRWLGNTPLCVTGPTVFGSAIASVGLVPGVNYHTGEFVYQGENKVFTTREKELLAMYKPNGVGHGDSGIPGGNNYTDLWNQRHVFNN